MPRQFGLQEGEASWKPLAKGMALFSYGHSVEAEIPSHPEGSVQTEESDEQPSAFSFHIRQPDLACENGLAVSFSHREFCTTNCMYPRSRMHKSYGLSTRSWSILEICWFTSQQWSLVWNSANKFKILLCKFTTIQVYWEACDIHVWQWMEHSVHRIRHCRRRWCPIVDVTSTDEKPWIPIWTYSREGLIVLRTYWHEKNGLEDSH